MLSRLTTDNILGDDSKNVIYCTEILRKHKNMHKKRKITGNCIWKSTDFLAVAFQKKSLNLAKFQPTYSKTKNKVIT